MSQPASWTAVLESAELRYTLPNFLSFCSETCEYMFCDPEAIPEIFKALWGTTKREKFKVQSMFTRVKFRDKQEKLFAKLGLV